MTNLDDYDMMDETSFSYDRSLSDGEDDYPNTRDMRHTLQMRYNAAFGSFPATSYQEDMTDIERFNDDWSNSPQEARNLQSELSR